ncbi:MAG: NADH-quinone oxidoreductase subunit J family protein [Candidatus Kariarchaeaceae archaeon]
MVDITLISFYITAIYILMCMTLALSVKKVMQSAYWLILMLVGVGIMFLLANSEILFALQISIYGGGIAVLLLFAVLLTEHDDYMFPTSIMGYIKTTWSQALIFILIAVNLVFLITSTVISKTYLGEDGTSGIQNVQDLGDAGRPVYSGEGRVGAFDVTKNYATFLWDKFGEVIPFLALLLLAALLGSIKLVIREWEIEELSEEKVSQIMPKEFVQ